MHTHSWTYPQSPSSPSTHQHTLVSKVSSIRKVTKNYFVGKSLRLWVSFSLFWLAPPLLALTWLWPGSCKSQLSSLLPSTCLGAERRKPSPFVFTTPEGGGSAHLTAHSQKRVSSWLLWFSLKSWAAGQWLETGLLPWEAPSTMSKANDSQP